MLAKFQSLIAAETEASYLEDRWKVLPGADRGTTLLLEDLLDAQHGWRIQKVNSSRLKSRTRSL